MNPLLLAGLGAAALVLGFSSRASASTPASLNRSAGQKIGGDPIRNGVDRYDENLLPSFQKQLVVLFARMRARGFDPFLWEGKRSPERAKQLSQTGTGIERSLHINGAAVDIVSESKLWNAGAAFWAALQEEAEALGLISGRAFTSKDLPHVQAVKVSEQTAFRKLSQSEQDDFIAGRLV